jgi:hypothetical protein
MNKFSYLLINFNVLIIGEPDAYIAFTLDLVQNKLEKCTNEIEFH